MGKEWGNVFDPENDEGDVLEALEESSKVDKL